MLVSIIGIADHYSLYYLPEREFGLRICIFKNDLTWNIPFTQLFVLQLHFRYVYILILEHPELFPLTNKKMPSVRTYMKTYSDFNYTSHGKKAFKSGSRDRHVKSLKTREQWFLLPDFVSVNENVWAWDLNSLRLSPLFSSCNKKCLHTVKFSMVAKQ